MSTERILAALDGTGPAVRIVSLAEFAATEEEGSEALLGTAENTIIPEDGDLMIYGDGGAGKTTLIVDLACHLAAGDAWLGIPVARPRRVLLVELEGPRPRFRLKLKRKLGAWEGRPLDDRVQVLEEPWGTFTFADPQWRTFLAEHVRGQEVDVVVCGPLSAAGMEAAGTLAEVREFLAYIADVRRQAARPLVVLLVHHENRAGQVSGAWEGAVDTLMHLSAQGHGRARLHWQKTRWASDTHATTMQLVWSEGDSFEVEEREELHDDDVAGQIVAAVAASPGLGWTAVEKATPGVGAPRRRAVRDGLLASGQLVNVVRQDGEDALLNVVPEKKKSRLYLPDDPTIRHLRPDPDADGTQTASAWGGRGDTNLRPASDLKEDADGTQIQTLPPDEDLGWR